MNNKASKTNKNQVKKQNQASEQGYNTEFASETDVQEVKEQNAQSASKKNQQ
ncbi:gamma-type small acid-soluble spore protein [Shouchella sp. 1P09AA]|uniref:gamma-type small acid-soluble spore protein n=1 Tax=Bacillaceae TaxID=186817 RepID=UPI000C088692|nr:MULTISPECIES: gamma-type small acid-soluble spore protein [Bacillaceae]UTR07695.1 gamma-type small acid-soluble spore protein [Alkalihalobacillus sp. LMS6]